MTVLGALACGPPPSHEVTARAQPRLVGLIGLGAIGQTLLAAWQQAAVPGHHIRAVLVRRQQLDWARALVAPGITVTADIGELLALAPHSIVEAAGQPAVAQFAEQVLQHGSRLLLLSVGSLADAVLHARLESAARRSGATLLLPVGAIAGLDGLLALRQAGLLRVQYTSTKPPRAWLGTPAAQQLDLLALRAPTVVFEGSARDAARLYPKNANLAAAVALAGLGFDRTAVQLVADPAASGNTGRIQAEGNGSRLDVSVAGSASADNPKTSAIVAHSVLSALANSAAAIAFG